MRIRTDFFTHRRDTARSDLGAAMVEFAIVGSLILFFFLAILDFALAVRTGDKTSNVTRSVARSTASAGREVGFGSAAVSAANAASADLPAWAIEPVSGAELWVFRAGPNGRPYTPAGTELSAAALTNGLAEGECGDCTRYLWDTAGNTWARVFPAGADGWLPAEQVTCTSATDPEQPHRVGVRMTTTYQRISGGIVPFVPSSSTKSTVARLEPDPVGACTGPIT